jgi:hypothetical protein
MNCLLLDNIIIYLIGYYFLLLDNWLLFLFVGVIGHLLSCAAFYWYYLLVFGEKWLDLLVLAWQLYNRLVIWEMLDIILDNSPLFYEVFLLVLFHFLIEE